MRKATPSTNDPEADEQAWPEYEDAPDNEVKRIAFGDGKTAGENAVALWKERECLREGTMWTGRRG